MVVVDGVHVLLDALRGHRDVAPAKVPPDLDECVGFGAWSVHAPTLRLARADGPSGVHRCGGYTQDMATSTKRMTLEEFLALPETEPPSELIDGEVLQKTMPTLLHSLVSGLLYVMLVNYLRLTKEGIAAIELRHAQRDESRSYLPDIAVTLRGPRSREEIERGPVERVPDIAIEVLSPDDRPGRIAEKVTFYLRAGALLVWVVDPVERTLDAYRRDRPSTHYAPPDIVDALPVLREFALDLTELFAQVDEELSRGQ
jgi:Uma2 family endonuclease